LTVTSAFFLLPLVGRAGAGGSRRYSRFNIAAGPIIKESSSFLKKRTKKLLLPGALALCVAAPARAQPVGNTSYATLPFVSQIYRPCWNCTAGLDPAQLFFPANPNSPFLNTVLMAQTRALSAQQSARGIVPTAGMQRWENTYEASFPAGTFPGEPAWIQAERARGKYPSLPEFVAWRTFISSHPNYADVAFDGGTMPPQPNYFRSWGAEWGYISPLTPLDTADCPLSKPQHCTWGDAFADRWAQTSKRTGGYGIQLSDFTDGQPYQNTLHDFNPRIVSAFLKTLPGHPSPGSTASQQSSWINRHAFTAWTDFLDQGYARFYATLAKDVGAATHHAPLLIGQCSIGPAYKRTEAVDERILARVLSPDNFICIWDDQVIQLGRSGPLANPPIGELAGYILAAAREPLVRNGANLEADDAAYWSAIAHFYPTLPPAAQQEVGLKLLKRLWVWSAWAHIADRNGNVRRALAFASRDYWDAGSLARIGPAATLIHTIVPAHPFGAALYYSAAVERAAEAASAAAAPPGGVPTTYLMPPVLQNVLDAGGTVGYYVSDAALPALSAANAPAAWVVLDAGKTLPATERAALETFAPIVTSVSGLQALPNLPLCISKGLAGFAFVSTEGHVTIVVSNPSSSPAAAPVAGTITVEQATPGRYQITELQSGKTATITQSHGQITWPVNLARWDTEIYTIQIPHHP
jgi:hypothetical protein